MENKEGIYFISSGLKAERYGKEMKHKFIKERLETRRNFFDHPIKRSKLKIPMFF